MNFSNSTDKGEMCFIVTYLKLLDNQLAFVIILSYKSSLYIGCFNTVYILVKQVSALISHSKSDIILNVLPHCILHRYLLQEKIVNSIPSVFVSSITRLQICEKPAGLFFCQASKSGPMSGLRMHNGLT